MHDTLIESAIGRRKPPGNLKNSYESQLKTNAVIDTYSGTKLNVVNQPSIGWQIK